MRKVLFFALMLLASAGCYDDSALWDEVKDHESRIVKLEELCAKMNSDISALQTLLDAVQKGDCITSVVPVMQGSDEIGYTIVFSSGEIITIYHGKDGADGQDGDDGSVPVIGVRKGTDGVYYWTVDGEWLLDSDGNRIRAVGADGKDGEDGQNGKDGEDGQNGKDGEDGTDGKDGEDGSDGQNGKDGADGTDGVDGEDGEDGVTPILKIEEGYWYVSYDEEQTWTILGKAVEEPDGCYLFEDVYQDDGFVYFTLKDGDVITVPFKSGLAISLVEDVTPALDYTMKMSYTITGSVGTAELAVMCEGGWTSSVRPVSGTEGEILLTAPLPYRDGKCVVLVNDNGLNIMKNVDLAPVIEFKDESVGAEMIRRFDQEKDGQLSLKEAAEVTSEMILQPLPATATSFDEFKYFTSVTDLYQLVPGGDQSVLESVILPESITYIHDVAFSGLKSLKSINIPKNVKIIGHSIFGDCTSLEEIHVHSLESWLDIDFGYHYEDVFFGSDLFNGNESVSPVLIDRNGDVIKDVVIPDHIDTIKEGPFSYIGIESVTLHSGVNAIEFGAFEGCQKLEKIYVDDLDHWMKISHESGYESSYPSIVDKNGTVMDDIVIPDGTETIPSYMFSGLGIKNVTLPSSVKSIEEFAFSGCGELLSIRIPSSVKTIGNSAFSGCTSVETVYVESMEDWLSMDFATGLGSNPLYASSTAGNNPRLADYDGNTLNLSVIPEGTTVIETSAYAGLAGLESIVIPSTVTEIGAYAFSGCVNLKNITIPESVRKIGEGAFLQCVSVQRVNIPSVEHWVSSIRFDGALSNPLTESACNGNSPVLVDSDNNVMTSIGIKEGTTGLGAGPYCGLTGMTEIVIPSSVDYIGSNPFVGCVNLEKITVPASVTLIDDYAFRNMTSLKEIIFLGGITEIQVLAFQGCTNLTDITIPSSVTTICQSAFTQCTALKKVSLSEGLQSIVQLAFLGCNSLEEITIPASVNTLIGAFLSCENLSTIYVKNPVPPSTGTWDIVFPGCPSMTKIYVPRESVDAYKSALGWSTHADLIEGYDF